MKQRITVMTEDSSLATHLSEPLRQAGYEVQILPTAPKFWQRALRFTSSLIIIDLDTVGAEAIPQCRRLRALSNARLMGVARRGGEEDLLCAFQAGFDDYMVKPVSRMELVARAEALLRRSQPRDAVWSSRLPVCENVTLDTEKRVLHVRGRYAKLTPIEFSLLECLVRNAGQVVPRSVLLRRVWGEERTPGVGSLNLYIYYLRRKIERDPRHPKHILTKWGIGYYLATNTSPAQTRQNITGSLTVGSIHTSRPPA